LSFDYNEKDVGWLLQCVSSERLTPYYIRAGKNVQQAFALYLLNVELSQSLYAVIQAIEVALRNVVHASMVKALGREEWWDTLPLHSDELDDIEDAKEQIRARAKSPRAGRIIAELGFGFWIKLFSNTYEKELWVRHTHKLFPAKLSRKVLHERLARIKDLRNRIAHHETLLRRDVEKDYRELLEIMGWISPTLQRWVESFSTFPPVFERYAEALRLETKPAADTPHP
jgi:hypothetical protein